MSRDRRKKRTEGSERGIRWGSVLVLALALIPGPGRLAAQAALPVGEGSNLKITLRMYNYGIAGDLLSRAEGEATAILNRAGLEAAWVDCPLTPADFKNYPACQGPTGTADFALRILAAENAARFSSHHEALGQALPCPRNQVGCSAYVFYRDVLDLAREGDASEYQLLGHALAHEIGHLLLGPNSHSAKGIMRGKWNHQDLQTIARAYLLFTDQQSIRMHDTMLARRTILPDQLAKAPKLPSR